MDQIVQLVGSLLILIGFMAAQRGLLATDSRRYLVVNVVGAGILAVVAFHERQWGFLLLEATWTAVSAYGLAQSWTQPRARSTARSQSARSDEA